jgi:hypothetical protein
MRAYTYPMTSLILFVDGLPVRFEVVKNKNVYHLKPLENLIEKTDTPTIKAVVSDHTWQINGTTDQDLIDQIIEDLTEHSFS